MGRTLLLATPYMVLALLLLAVSIITLLTRSDRLMRLGVLGAVVGTLPWALCGAVVVFLRDAELAAILLRLGTGPLSLVGPSLLLMLLGSSGQLERHRVLVGGAWVVGVGLMLLTWYTPLVVTGARWFVIGVYYTDGGPLLLLHIGFMAVAAAVGTLIVQRAVPGRERSQATRVILLILVLATFGLVDTIMVYRLSWWIPMAWLPAVVCASLALYLITRTDLLQRQGFDETVARELLLVAGAAAVMCVLLGSWLVAELPAVARAVLAASLLVLAGIMVRPPPRRRLDAEERLGAETTRLVTELLVVKSVAALQQRVARFLREHVGMAEVAVLRVDEQGLRGSDGQSLAAYDAELQAWFRQHGEPLLVNDIFTMRLGALRERLQRLLGLGGWSLWVPLFEGATQLGFLVARQATPRALRDYERACVTQVAAALRRTMRYQDLLHQAMNAAKIQRELEVAAALRARVNWDYSERSQRATWRVRVRSNVVAERYLEHSWLATPEGFVLLLVDIAGPTVTAALMGAALFGAFPTLVGQGHVMVTAQELVKRLHGVIGASAVDANVNISVVVVASHHVSMVASAAHQLVRLAAVQGEVSSAPLQDGEVWPVDGALVVLAGVRAAPHVAWQEVLSSEPLVNQLDAVIAREAGAHVVIAAAPKRPDAEA